MSKKSAELSRHARARAAMQAQVAAQHRRNRLIVGSVVVVLVIVVVVAFVLSRGSDTSGDASATVPEGATEDYGIVVGQEDAPTEIVFYEDPQCPICAELESVVAEPVAAAVERGDVSVEYRVVSFLDGASTNDYSSRAANALVAVRHVAGPEAFAAMHQLVFENQTPEGGPGHSDDQLVEYAVEAGAAEDEVRPLIEGGTFDQWVTNATDAMSRNGVNGTPTVFIDGEPAGADPRAAMEAVLAVVD